MTENRSNFILHQDDDYTGIIQEDNSVSVFYRGEEVWQHGPFRLYGQAEGAMREFIAKSKGEVPEDGITLDVENFSIDADMLFRRLDNG